MEIVNKTEFCELVGRRPVQFKLRQHTIEDLWKVDVGPSRFILRPVVDTPPKLEVPITTDEKLKEVYIEYKIKAARNDRPWTKIDYNNYWDRMRDKLHRLLLRYKVIV